MWVNWIYAKTKECGKFPQMISSSSVVVPFRSRVKRSLDRLCYFAWPWAWSLLTSVSNYGCFSRPFISFSSMFRPILAGDFLSRKIASLYRWRSPGNIVLKKSITILAVCAVAASCWNQTSSSWNSPNSARKNLNWPERFGCLLQKIRADGPISWKGTPYCDPVGMQRSLMELFCLLIHSLRCKCALSEKKKTAVLRWMRRLETPRMFKCSRIERPEDCSTVAPLTTTLFSCTLLIDDAFPAVLNAFTHERMGNTTAGGNIQPQAKGTLYAK